MNEQTLSCEVDGSVARLIRLQALRHVTGGWKTLLVFIVAQFVASIPLPSSPHHACSLLPFVCPASYPSTTLFCQQLFTVLNHDPQAILIVHCVESRPTAILIVHCALNHDPQAILIVHCALNHDPQAILIVHCALNHDPKAILCQCCSLCEKITASKN